MVWSPTVGTEYLPQRPMEAFQAGNVIDIPYMIGTTANETVIFVYEALDFPMSQVSAWEWMRCQWGAGRGYHVQ